MYRLKVQIIQIIKIVSFRYCSNLYYRYVANRYICNILLTHIWDYLYYRYAANRYICNYSLFIYIQFNN